MLAIVIVLISSFDLCVCLFCLLFLCFDSLSLPVYSEVVYSTQNNVVFYDFPLCLPLSPSLPILLLYLVPPLSLHLPSSWYLSTHLAISIGSNTSPQFLRRLRVWKNQTSTFFSTLCRSKLRNFLRWGSMRMLKTESLRTTTNDECTISCILKSMNVESVWAGI